MANNFKDLFSAQSSEYATYRPHYPQALFEYLASLCPERDLAWDVGTGSGQAAVALAPYFGQVIGTDPSAQQLEHAKEHPKVEYRQGTAEKSGMPELSANLVTVAQAFHWLNQEEFFKEVRRVAMPGAVLAVWCYEISVVNQDVDPVMMRLYRDILGAYWDPARRMVEEGYRHEKFPFNELETPPMDLKVDWDLRDYMGYLGTWSALTKYRKEKGVDPREMIAEEMLSAWGDPAKKRQVSWPLSLRVFQVV
jgi:SAM-dependent methyltransferase